MAIKKAVTEPNGVVTKYHRIALLSIDVNNQTSILVHSYLDADGRQIEKDYKTGLYNGIDAGMMNFPYVMASYISTAYDEDMTVTKAYEYLKTLPKFAGAEDV